MRQRLILFLMAALVLPLTLGTLDSAHGADLDDARKLYASGKYAEAEKFAAEQVERKIWNENWPRLLIQCRLTRGKYQEALSSYEAAIKRYPTSMTLRMMGIEALEQCGLADEALQARSQMLLLLQTSPSRYASRDNLIAMGRFFVMRGEDARQVLELFYDRVLDSDPRHLPAYIASAELALSKNDYKVASETVAKAESFAPDDPHIQYLKARAWETTDGEKSKLALARALEINPNHIPSLLMTANAAIDREQYQTANEILGEVLKINQHEQEAWALKAVLAHLRGDFKNEKEMRRTALSTWSDNPYVDFTIGKKLSQKYRFEEAADYQRRAIEFDSRYLPAQLQLAQDLLRLGQDEIGWELVRQVANEDPYNAVAINLINLNSRVQSFQILQRDGIHLRMESREAAIYGDAVLNLLAEAKEVLCKKYEVDPGEPIVVEIFPQQKDFAIRTFGLPGGAGFLGVCFGRVITANSPASQGDTPSNWQSVLWHEFCHVVTLEKTKNRMPRWLSEGISVYEERQRDSSWGESMTPIYRQMMLGDELTPVSRLSGAFLSPPSPIHLQFAYYESSLVVEFLIKQHGLETLKSILDDLGGGLGIDDALAQNVGSLERLDVEFAEYARKRAAEFGADADWDREAIPEDASEKDLQAFVEANPTSYWGLRRLAAIYIASERYQEAREALEKLRELGTNTGERGDPLAMLARVYRELGEEQSERETLEKIISLSSDSLPSLRRLIELAKADEDWDRVVALSNQILAINPLLAEGQQSLSDAAEKLDRPSDVVGAMRALAKMDPIDPAAIDFRLARALSKLNESDRAKYHVLRALEEAPRYREAHRLLIELSENASAADEGENDSRPDADSPSGDAEPKPAEAEAGATGAEADASDSANSLDATPEAQVNTP